MDLGALYKGFDDLYVSPPRGFESVSLEICTATTWNDSTPTLWMLCVPASKRGLTLTKRTLSQFKVNALGVIHSIHAFLPLLRGSHTKRIVVIASEGSQADFVFKSGLANMAAYGMSKAASLIAVTKWAVKLAPEGFTVVNVAPGMVNTKETFNAPMDPAERAALEGIMEDFQNKGRPVRMITPSQSVEMQLRAIDGLTTEHNGKFLSPKREAWGW